LANNLNTSGQLDATDGLTGVVPVANGGTGQSSLTANAVILGNGTSGVTTVAPSTSGNVLVSNGTTWVSQAPAGGGVTSFNGNTGALAGYQLITNGTIASGATTINIGSLPSGYKTFKIFYTGTLNTTNSIYDPGIRVSTNGGSTYISSNNYFSSCAEMYSDSVRSVISGAAQPNIIPPRPLWSASPQAASVTIALDIIQSSNGSFFTINGNVNATSVGNNSINGIFMGIYNQTTYVDGIQLFRVNGNKAFANGNYIVYGAK
jgi:hypothetical protein